MGHDMRQFCCISIGNLMSWHAGSNVDGEHHDRYRLQAGSVGGGLGVANGRVLMVNVGVR